MGDCFGQYPFLDPSYDTDERYQKVCQQICAHSQWIRSVLIFSPLHKVNETHYERLIATCSDDEYLKFWSIKDGHSVEKFRLGFMMNCLEELFFKEEEGAKRQMFVIGGELGRLIIYDYSTNTIFKELTGSSRNILSVKVLPNKKDPLSKNGLVISGNSQGEVRFWDWQKGITIHRIKLGIQPVQSLGVFNQNKGVTTLVNSYEHKICVWSMNNKKIRKIRQFEQHTNWVRSIMCETIKSPNQNSKEVIISAGDDNVIRFFDLKSGSCSKTLQIHTSGIIYIDILQNSLISCESRGRIAITHLDTMNTSYIATGLCLDYYRGFSVEHNETDNQAYLCVIGSSPKKSSYHFLNVYKGKIMRNNVIFDTFDQNKEKILEIEG